MVKNDLVGAGLIVMAIHAESALKGRAPLATNVGRVAHVPPEAHCPDYEP
jgi:hypothetical protein